MARSQKCQTPRFVLCSEEPNCFVYKGVQKITHPDWLSPLRLAIFLLIQIFVRSRVIVDCSKTLAYVPVIYFWQKITENNLDTFLERNVIYSHSRKDMALSPSSFDSTVGNAGCCSVIAVLLLASASLPLGAQEPLKIAGKDLSELLKRWPREYVRWTITEAERERYKALTSDKERLAFIERFWARRDPTPETPENEYRADYLERFAYAANRFSAGKPGWATDRGRIYLILGPPHSIQQNPMGRYGLERPSEIWTYNNLDIPQIPASIDVKFVDFRGTGDFEIVSDLETSAPIETIFGVAETPLMALALRRGRVGSVDPRTGRDQFREVDSSQLTMREFDLQDQLRAIEEYPTRSLQALEEVVEAQATFARLNLQGVAGVIYTAENGVRIPVSVAVPYRELSARRQGEVFSYRLDYLIRLIDEEKKETARVEDALTFTFTEGQYQRAAEHQLVLEESLPVEPGTYTLQAILRDSQEDRVGTLEKSLEVPALGEGELSLSSIFLAADLVESRLRTPRPFQFGTVRVVPSMDGAFDSSESLRLYLEAYGTENNPPGGKRIKVDFFILRDGRLHMGVPASHLFPTSEPVGITATIPLRKCSPGEYAVRVRVTDEITGKVAETESPFTLRDRSQSSR